MERKRDKNDTLKNEPKKETAIEKLRVNPDGHIFGFWPSLFEEDDDHGSWGSRR